jgi:dipeptidyl aminopeptidase/acylaminoacyl peptidase
MRLTTRSAPKIFCLCLLAVLAAVQLLAAEDGSWKPLELADIMRMRAIESPVLSDDGAWAAYELRPDRGDGVVEVVSADGATRYTIERGTGPAISSDSRWVAALVKPTLEESEEAKDSGGKDGPKTGLALLATADGTVMTVERVESFAFSEDGRWLAYHRHEEEKGEDEEPGESTEPEEESAEAPETGAAEEPEAGAGQVEGVPEPAVPETEPGEAEAGSEEPPVEPGPEEEPAEQEPVSGEEPEEEEAEEEKDEDERLGRTLVLRELAAGTETEIPHVTEMAFDERSEWLAYAVAAPGGEDNGVYVRALAAPEAPPTALRTDPSGRHGHLTWTDRRDDAPAATSRLGFVAAPVAGDPEEGEAPGETDPGDLVVWSAGEASARVALASSEAPEGWYVPAANELAWSDDGERLFFGLKPDDERIEDEDEEQVRSGDDGTGGPGEIEEEFDPYDLDAILEDRGVDVWHWDDPLLQSQQKKQWEEEKTRTYRAVYHLDGGRMVPLADREMRQVEPVDNPRASLGAADVSYLQRITWDGWYFDLYHVSLDDGEKTRVAEALRGGDNAISPDGRWVVYYRTPHWYLFDADDGSTRNLTEGLATGFADEDHDYPEPAPGYGIADWVARPPVSGSEGAPAAEAVLIYDKFDLWRFRLAAGAGPPVNLTRGRESRTIHRVVDLDPEGEERTWVEPDERLLLQAYSDALKHRGIVEAHVDEPGTRVLEPGLGKTYRVETRAADADTILYTRESYTEFPDLWISDLALSNRRKLSDANPEIAGFGWGTAELVHWRGDDGEPLDGVLIKPAGYVEGQRYPVLVYFYRLFSPVLHRFNEPAVNHRPSFPFYASHGYAVFLPDIRFEIGRPGHAATRALTSGVRHLVEMGVADPDAIGLHGHSWSGYQAAFVVTQTDVFAAAVAGAPVTNMTSAYGGIRYGTGLARMFQYEQTQSRLGVSLWQGRDRYIESSPLFYADRIDTPLLMMFGDEDGAVPWTQGIELYLALRRLRKPAWLLQYRGEGHHLEKYGNKLDYSLKMREFFDHYLKGEPAPEWLTEGVPYRGK